MRACIFSFIFVLLFSPVFALLGQAKTTTPTLERLMYYMDTDSGYASLKKNAGKIDILSPQAFTFDATGTLTADVSARMMNVWEDHTRIKLMPLVENEHFDLTVAHALLTDTVAQDRLIKDLVAIGKQNQYWGYQMDMEHMDHTDRALYTAFTKKMADALHAEGLQYSIAVVAKVSDDPKDFSEKAWTKWGGVFDYAALHPYVDFITIMVYDQDDSVGPTSTLTWYTKVIDYAKTVIPKEKLSIGIPFYGWEWIPGTGKKVSSHTYKFVTDQIKAKTVQSTQFNSVLGTGIMTFFVKKNGSKENRVLWYENVESFKLKIGVLKKEGVRGFSAWALGQEDSRIWGELSSRVK
jgi:spore germination protein YaaH